MAAASPAAAPAWIILRRVASMLDDSSVEMAGDLSVALAAPPRASVVTLRKGGLRRLGDDADDADSNITTIAADTAGLLLYASASPFVGIEDGDHGALFIARNFLPADAGPEVLMPTTIFCVPNRARLAPPGNSTCIKNVGLASRPGSGGTDYVVAELRIPGGDSATLISFRSGTDAWVQRELSCPSSALPWLWVWSGDDVVAHNGMLWWIDFRAGLLGCDLFADEPSLCYVEPPVFPIQRMEVTTQQCVENWYMVKVSHGMLRFVAISCLCTTTTEEPLVLVWRLGQGPSGEPMWEHQCSTSLTAIWASDRYQNTGMPQEVPILALLDPEIPDLVYFFLGDNIFSVNVSEGRMMDFFHLDLLHGLAGNMLPPVMSWRTILTWDLHPSQDHENLHMPFDDFMAILNSSIPNQEAQQTQSEHDLRNVSATSETDTTSFLVKLPMDFDVNQPLVPSTQYTYATARALLDEVQRRLFKWVSRQTAYALLSNAAAFVSKLSDAEGLSNQRIVVIRNTDFFQLNINYNLYTTTARRLKERKVKGNDNSLIDRYEINGNLYARRRMHLKDNTEFQLLQWRVKRRVPEEHPPNPPCDSSGDIVKAILDLTASNKEIAASHRALADSFKELADQDKQRMQIIIQNHNEVMAAVTKMCSENK